MGARKWEESRACQAGCQRKTSRFASQARKNMQHIFCSEEPGSKQASIRTTSRKTTHESLQVRILILQPTCTNMNESETTEEDQGSTTPLLAGEQPSATYGDSETSNETSAVPSREKSRIQSLPWILMGVALAMFTLPWVKMAILDRYFLKPKWGDALPGLNSTPWRKLTMRGHMSTGAISLLCGPLQFSPRIRKQAPRIHRWTGRIYCTCAMLSCLFGLVFIALKGRLVGGWNMTVAFAFAGSTIGILGYKVWEAARAAKAGLRDFTSHRNWGIRSYSQIMAPMLYRYWYVLVEIFGIYKTPVPPRMGGYCRSDDICPDYLRLFDMVHCWTYWLTSLAIAELVIYYLPKMKPQQAEVEFDGETSNEASEAAPEAPAETLFRTASPTMVNAIGWCLAIVTLCTTGKLFLFDGGDD